jgi:hypothetical protein
LGVPPPSRPNFRNARTPHTRPNNNDAHQIKFKQTTQRRTDLMCVCLLVVIPTSSKQTELPHDPTDNSGSLPRHDAKSQCNQRRASQTGHQDNNDVGQGDQLVGSLLPRRPSRDANPCRDGGGSANDPVGCIGQAWFATATVDCPAPQPMSFPLAAKGSNTNVDIKKAFAEANTALDGDFLKQKLAVEKANACPEKCFFLIFIPTLPTR